MVGSIVVQVVQSACRAVAAATLLAGRMETWLCNGLGGLDVFLNVACIILVIGFFYTLIALRYNPLRYCLLSIFSLEFVSFFQMYWWYLFSAVSGAAVTVATFLALNKAKEEHLFCGQRCLFGTLLGYCGLPFHYDVNNYSQVLYVVDVSAPTTVMIVMSIGSFLALRARVQIMKSMSFEQSVILYVRFFSYNGYFLRLSVVQTVAYHQTPNSKTLTQFCWSQR